MSFKNYLIIYCIVYSPLFIFGQENTLENQFDAVLKRSNNYQEFKVVKKTDLNFLKESSLDSIALYKNAIVQMQSELESQKIELNIIQNSLKETQNKLLIAEQKENDISFLGIQTSKTIYNSMVWAIITFLVFILCFIFYKYNNSNQVTRVTKKKLDELENEYELHRQRAIEREQQLNRKLLDEMNKNK